MINSCVSETLKALVVQGDFMRDGHNYSGIIKH